MDGNHGSFGGCLHVTVDLKIASSSSCIQMAHSEQQPTGLQRSCPASLNPRGCYCIQNSAYASVLIASRAHP